jgi:hypothetical protein
MIATQALLFVSDGTSVVPDEAPEVPTLIGTGRLNKGIIGTHYDTITCTDNKTYLRVLVTGGPWPRNAILGAPPDQWQPYHG